METMEEGIFFVSVESGQCVSYCQIENSKFLYRTTVLGDGGVCVCGKNGYCAVLKPSHVLEDPVGEYVQRMYSSLFAAVSFFSPPLKYIFAGVQEKAVAIQDAFDLVVRSKYHRKSIQEWASVHLIVMSAVNRRYSTLTEI